MICPYCKKSVDENNGFCPECGQSLRNDQQSLSSDTDYWEELRSEGKVRYEQYQTVINEHSRIEKSQRSKKLIAIISILGIIALVVFGCYQYQVSQTKKLNLVKSGLPGVTLSCSDHKSTGLLSWKYVYYTLEFNDDETVDYYEYDKYDDEPQFIDTYPYTVTRTFGGDYVISVNGVSFELEVTSNYEPKSISYKD